MSRYRIILKSGKEFVVTFDSKTISPITNYVKAMANATDLDRATMVTSDVKGTELLLIVMNQIAAIEKLCS